MSSNPVTVICGPTAVGKTEYAIRKALEEDGEIISADSGQIYRGLDIGTAKPTKEEQSRVPFHLIGILDPDKRFSAADFRERTLQNIKEIESRGKRVFVVGGTGLYLKVLENGIFEGPPADPETRSRLEKLAEEEGIESLFKRLKEVDPITASKMDGFNTQRIIRALEVYELTGRPISEFWDQTGPTSRTCLTRFKKIGLNLSRGELYRRINDRVDRMMEKGWLEETKNLLEKWGPEAPGLKIIGYKELVGHLQGKTTRDRAVELIKTHTRRYAKRQMTWFRGDSSIRWIEPSSGTPRGA